MSYFDKTTVGNLGCVYAERGTNSLPFDYPYTEANSVQALSATTFLPESQQTVIAPAHVAT